MIITLCGSLRFEEAFHYWNEKLSLDGHCVFSCSVMPSQKQGQKEWYTPEVKAKLDAVHKSKIYNSDAIFVVTGPLGQRSEYSAYIGESTHSEIEWAHTAQKQVLYDYNTCTFNGCASRLFQKPPCALCYE